MAKRWSIIADHDRWGVCGFSSGGTCAFTAGWLRPDVFGGWSVACPGSQMAGGNPCPRLIAQTPGKPLRIFMQAGHPRPGWNEPEDN